MVIKNRWEERFARCGAFWKHDGDPLRPFAELSSPNAVTGKRRISDGFFDAGKVAEEDPGLYVQAASELGWHVSVAFERTFAEQAACNLPKPRAIGAAYGAVALSVLVGSAAGIRSAFAQKDKDGTLKLMRAQLQPGELFVPVEDTVTTGTTLQALMDAASSAISGECSFTGTLFAICNRSGSTTYKEYRIEALIEPTFRIWDEGENPFTPDGAELVPPVRPKTHWHELTRAYA